MVWTRAGRLTDIRKFQKTTSFLVSRHPFTRIASAFRNKIGSDTRGEEIIIDKQRRNICVAARGKWQKGDPEPSFPEFVRYLIKTEPRLYDEHWEVISYRCK